MNIQQALQSISSGLFLLCSGCASCIHHTVALEKPRPFEGVRVDAGLLANPHKLEKPAIHPVFVVPFAIIDLPLSAVLDLLFLPFDLARDQEDEAPL